MVLGIDPSTTVVGVAIIDGQVAGADVIKAPTNLDADLRIHYLRGKIDAIFEKCPGIKLVAIEQMFSGGNFADGPLHAAASAFRTAAKLRGIRVVEFSVSAWKKVVTGHGAASKAEVMEMMRCRWDMPDLCNDNASDALGVASAALDGLTGRKRGKR